jgi:hypothetical protein
MTHDECSGARRRRRSDRQPADLAGRRQLPFHEGRRRSQRARDVVEAEPCVVGGKQRGRVDLKVEQVPYRVLIFGSIEAMQGLARTGVRPERECAIQIAFECPQELIDGGGVRTLRRGQRWHGAGAQLAHDLFPEIPVVCDALRVEGVEGQPTRPEAIVVAADAVLLEELLARRCCRGARER